MTEFRILGPLEVVDETGPVGLTGPKQRALLALLLIHAGETLSTDRIVDELWGDNPPRTATTSLWNLVAQLRKVLPPDVPATKPPGYVPRLEAMSSISAASKLVASRTANAEERSDLLRQGLALWRGGPLADVAYETFARRGSNGSTSCASQCSRIGSTPISSEVLTPTSRESSKRSCRITPFASGSEAS